MGVHRGQPAVRLARMKARTFREAVSLGVYLRPRLISPSAPVCLLHAHKRLAPYYMHVVDYILLPKPFTWMFVFEHTSARHRHPAVVRWMRMLNLIPFLPFPSTPVQISTRKYMLSDTLSAPVPLARTLPATRLFDVLRRVHLGE